MQPHYDLDRSRLDDVRIDSTGLFGRKFMYVPYHNVPLDSSQYTPQSISSLNPQYIVPMADFEVIVPQDRDNHPPSAFHVKIESDDSISLSHGSNDKIKLSGKRVLVAREDARGHIDKGKLAAAMKVNRCDIAVIIALNTGISASGEKDAFNMVFQAQPDLGGVSVSLGSGVPSDSQEKLVFFTSPTSISRSATSVTQATATVRDASSASPELAQQVAPDRIIVPPTFKREKKLYPLGNKQATIEIAHGAVESNMGPTNTEFSVGVCTTEGSRPTNEDSPKVAVYILPNGMQVVDMTVKDGAGGHQAGDVAAAEANAGGSHYLETLANENGRDKQLKWEKLKKEAKELQTKDPKLNFEAALGLTLASKVLKAENTAVYKWSRDKRINGRSTRSGALVIGNMAFIANVGDSRTTVFDARGGVISTTKDHSLVQQLVDMGQISAQDALTNPNRNVIYRALGEKATVEADLGKDIFMSWIPVGGTIAIYCDGINGGLGEVRPGEKIGRLVSAKNRAVRDIATGIVEQAAPGSGDNDTLILARRIK